MILLLIGCDTTVSHETEVPTKTENLKERGLSAIRTGNIESYNVLSQEALLSSNPERILFYSLAFAEKHNYGKAYFDCFMVYSSYYNLGSSNELEKLMLYFLARSKECGYEFARVKLNGKFVNYEEIEASSVYGSFK
jgi:hypothetical protein